MLLGDARSVFPSHRMGAFVRVRFVGTSRCARSPALVTPGRVSGPSSDTTSARTPPGRTRRRYDPSVDVRTLIADDSGRTETTEQPPRTVPDGGWIWIDVVGDDGDVVDLMVLAERFDLDRLATSDAIVDVNMPKLDDFGHHLLAVFHGLSEDRIATYEVDCFLTDQHLLTVRTEPSPAVEALWSQAQQRPELAMVTIDELTALLADLLTRRLLSVLEAFDARVEELTDKALRADGTLLEDLTAVRTDLAAVRRVVHPQREILDVLRHSTSVLVSPAGRRRFSDVFDVASRAASGLDEARSALAETLDAYRGAEARQATEVTKVLTVYAAIMLPLSLVAGVFGMNFVNLPLLGREWGWVVAVGVMVLIATVSLGVFIALGWVRRPSGRETGRTLGKGLLEATRTPVQLAGALFEISTMPIRATTARRSRTSPGRTIQRGHDTDPD